MLDPQYAIARTWSRSSRLMKSGTQEYEAIRSCSYFTNTRRLLKFLHLPVCIQACCLWDDTWACTSPPTPHSSFNEKENQIGTAPYPPTVGPPISPPPRYVPPCLFWPSGGIKTCMLGVIQSCHSQRSEKAHRYPAGLLPSSLIHGDMSQILHELKLVNPQRIFFPFKMLSMLSLTTREISAVSSDLM